MELILVVGAAIVAVLVLMMIMRFSRGKNEIEITKKAPKASPETTWYTKEEVGKHDREGDIWVIVKHRLTGEERVYDLTEYADMHPGGDVIYDSAGKDATEKFNGPQHPPTVHELIDAYWIGRVMTS